GAVLQLVPVGRAGLEPGAVAGAEHRLAFLLDQHDLALQHPDELVLALVPVSLARPCPGRQAQQVDPELPQAEPVALPAVASRLARYRMFLWISHPVARRRALNVDLRHGRQSIPELRNPVEQGCMSPASTPLIDPVELARDLICRPSVTPADEGAM